MNLIQALRRIHQQRGNDEFAIQEAQFPLIKRLYNKYGLVIKLTCGACPEQYDVFKNGKQVAYYRLRHGQFRVDFPDCGGETIYDAEPIGDGIFEDNERLKYLTAAMRELNKKLLNQ